MLYLTPPHPTPCRPQLTPQAGLLESMIRRSLGLPLTLSASQTHIDPCVAGELGIGASLGLD